MNSLVFSENTEMIAGIKALTGKSVTVFTNSGGVSGNGFTGVLIDVGENFIKLTTSPHKPNCKHCRKLRHNDIYTHTIIAKEHIIAVTYYTL